MKYLIILMMLLGQANKLSHNNKEVEIRIIDYNYRNGDSLVFTCFFGVINNDTVMLISKNTDTINSNLFEEIELGAIYKLNLKLVVNLNDFKNGKTEYENIDKPGCLYINYRPKDPKKELYRIISDSVTGNLQYIFDFGIFIDPGFKQTDDEISYKLKSEKDHGDSVSFHFYYTSKELLGNYILKSKKVIKE